MLIRFTLENFLSFRDRVSFSMIPGKGLLKPHHKTDRVGGISTLKAAVIFGANASGKSNLIKAIDFGRRLVLIGTKPDRKIDYQAYRLDLKAISGDSRIEYEIQHKGKNYAYGFVFNSKEIKEEWLYEINKKSDFKIFERRNGVFDLEPLLKKNKKEDEQQFLKFTAKGTPINQLFLTEIRTRRVKDNVKDINDLLNVYDWFLNALKVVFPNDKYNAGLRSELNNEKVQHIYEELLKYFGTGIDGICLDEVDLNSIDVPSKFKERIINELNESSDNETRRIMLVSPANITYFFSIRNSNTIVEKFMTKHNVRGQEKQENFDTSDESDGTNRIIDFIPLIMDLLRGNNVFVIDEMERSLHPNLIYDLFDLFLEKGLNVNSQLITASHESSLLTQKLLRKDEIWFVVKDDDNISRIHSLEEYNVRFDKQIRKDYLLGRFKAIPRIGNRSDLTFLPNQNI